MAKTKQRAAGQRKTKSQPNTNGAQGSVKGAQATGNNIQPGTQNTRVRKSLGPQRKKRHSWIFISSVIALVIIALGTFLVVRLQQDSTLRTGQDNVLQAVSTLDSQTLATVGVGGVKNPMHAIKGDQILKGSHGKPELFYFGSEFCSNCAAQRWSTIIALSRFGNFTHLDPLITGDGHIVTFSFHNSAYNSQYIDFVGIEATNNQQPKPQLLDHMTPAQQQAYNKYNQSPFINQDEVGKTPFINIANQQVSVGAYFQPDILSGRSYQDIVDQLKDTNSDISRNVLGTANLLTAALCVATSDQPGNVCTVAPIPEMQKLLPKPSTDTGSHLALKSIWRLDIQV